MLPSWPHSRSGSFVGRQDLCDQQIRIAYDTSNTRALENLRCMEHDLTQAIGKVAGLW